MKMKKEKEKRVHELVMQKQIFAWRPELADGHV
jgi:hypothetical protein